MTKAELLAAVCRETAEQWRVMAERADEISDGMKTFGSYIDDSLD